MLGFDSHHYKEGDIGVGRIVGLKVFYAGLQEDENKLAVMQDLNSMRYAVSTVLACGIVGKICKKYGIVG